MISTQVKRSWRKGMTKVWLKFLTVLYIINCLSAGILWILLLVVDYTNPMIHTVCTVNNNPVCSICMQKWCAVSDHHSCWTHCCQYEKWCVPSSQMTDVVPYCKIKVLKNVQSLFGTAALNTSYQQQCIQGLNFEEHTQSTTQAWNTQSEKEWTWQ